MPFSTKRSQTQPVLDMHSTMETETHVYQHHSLTLHGSAVTQCWAKCISANDREINTNDHTLNFSKMGTKAFQEEWVSSLWAVTSNECPLRESKSDP